MINDWLWILFSAIAMAGAYIKGRRDGIKEEHIKWLSDAIKNQKKYMNPSSPIEETPTHYLNKKK